MAFPKDVQELADRILKNDVSTREDLRKLLEMRAINQLRMTLDQADNLHRLVEAELATGVKGVRKESLQNIEHALLSSTETDGAITLPPSDWKLLEKVRDIINKDSGSDFELGHADTSIISLNMALIRHTIAGKQKLSGEDKKKIAYIEQVLAVSDQIDKVDDNFVSTMSHQLKTKGFTDKDLITIIDATTRGAEIDVTVATNFIAGLEDGSHGTITIDLEPHSANRNKGNLSKLLGVKAGKGLRNVYKIGADPVGQAMDKLFKPSKTNNPATIKASPSVIDRLEAVLDAQFRGTKMPSKVQKSKVRVSRRMPAKNSEIKRLKALVRKRTKDLKTKIAAAKKKKRFVIPTITLKAILNASLAEFIRKRMEDESMPTSRSYLRNVSGRFSESAKILSLTRTEAGIYIGTYDFMKNPYGTFLPGQRLGSQQRDPRVYIEGAAREIAQIVLKRQFKGLSLELK